VSPEPGVGAPPRDHNHHKHFTHKKTKTPNQPTPTPGSGDTASGRAPSGNRLGDTPRNMMPGMDKAQYEQDGGCIFNVENPIADKKTAEDSKKERSLSSPQWSASSALVGEEVTLKVSTTNVPEGDVVHFTIWEENADKTQDAPVKKTWARNEGGSAEVKWKYVYVHDPQKPLTKKPKFVFEVKAFKCEVKESSGVEMGAEVKTVLEDEKLGPLADQEYQLVISGTDIVRKGTTDSGGKLEEIDLPPGLFEIHPVYPEETENTTAGLFEEDSN